MNESAPSRRDDDGGIPLTLKPYLFHGVDLQWRNGDTNALAECPFCDEPKFSVALSDGQWRCLRCNQKGGEETKNSSSFDGGNGYTFLHRLWRFGQEFTKESALEELARERGLLYPETLSEWGVIDSPLVHDWLVPAWPADIDAGSEVRNLYRYATEYKANGDGRRKAVRILKATPGIVGDPSKAQHEKGSASKIIHQVFGMSAFNTRCKTVYVCEGPWDGMALYEVMKRVRNASVDKNVLRFKPTNNDDKCLLAEACVIAVPGCNVFYDKWASILAGKKVVFLFDNDYPGKNKKTGGAIPPAAFTGLKRIIQTLSMADDQPTEVGYLYWGDDGYNRDFPDGYDVRDWLTKDGSNIELRAKRLEKLLERVRPIPPEWVQGRNKTSKAGGVSIDFLPCTTWKTLVNDWRKGFKWTEGLDRALSVMIATIISTRIHGDQLWFKIISPPSGGKSTLAEAVSVNRTYVLPKSTIRGFHSGYKDGTDDDHSLIALLKGLCLVNKDGDTILKTPNLNQLLSEARDAYDRTSRTHYRHGRNRDYDDNPFTWLLCGTSALRGIDKSELGARFLDCVIMRRIDDELEDAIMERKGWSQLRLMTGEDEENSGDTQIDPDELRARQRTGGYIDYLGKNVRDLMKKVRGSQETIDRCKSFGKFVAYLRARPSDMQDEDEEREIGGRLMGQFTKLTVCLAVVLNKTSTDDKEVVRRVTQVALDTARGRTLEIVRHLYEAGQVGLEAQQVAVRTVRATKGEGDLLRFLHKIGAVEHYHKRAGGYTGKPKWRLTAKMKRIYEDVMGVPSEDEIIIQPED